MTTEKQLKANKENAKKGGVKTAKGKALIRYNAVRHGLLSKEVLLPSEDGDILEELRKSIMLDLQPEGILEEILCDRMVSSIWRLKRAIKIETNLFSERYSGRELFNINRYETAIERQQYKALHEIIRLQMARKGKEPPAPLAVDIDVSN